MPRCILLKTEGQNREKAPLCGRGDGVRLFFVFAFSDFTAWNATVGVDGEWRKLVYRQATSVPNDNLKRLKSVKGLFLFL